MSLNDYEGKQFLFLNGIGHSIESSADVLNKFLIFYGWPPLTQYLSQGGRYVYEYNNKKYDVIFQMNADKIFLSSIVEIKNKTKKDKKKFFDFFKKSSKTIEDQKSE